MRLVEVPDVKAVDADHLRKREEEGGRRRKKEEEGGRKRVRPVLVWEYARSKIYNAQQDIYK